MSCNTISFRGDIKPVHYLFDVEKKSINDLFFVNIFERWNQSDLRVEESFVENIFDNY